MVVTNAPPSPGSYNRITTKANVSTKKGTILFCTGTALAACTSTTGMLNINYSVGFFEYRDLPNWTSSWIALVTLVGNRASWLERGRGKRSQGVTAMITMRMTIGYGHFGAMLVNKGINVITLWCHDRFRGAKAPFILQACIGGRQLLKVQVKKGIFKQGGKRRQWNEEDKKERKTKGYAIPSHPIPSNKRDKNECECLLFLNKKKRPSIIQ